MAPRKSSTEEALQSSGPTLPRTAKAKALQNKVWQDRGAVRRKRAESSSDVVPRPKEPRLHKSSASQYRRRAPAVVSEDSDDGHDIRSQAPKYRKHPAYLPESEEDEEVQADDDADNDDELEGDADHDLQYLDDHSLRKAMDLEAVQWAKQKPNQARAARRTLDDFENVPGGDEYEATTASENDRFQGERELPTDEDSGNEKENDDDVERRKKKRRDKRGEAREKELPHWADVSEKYQHGTREKAAVAMGFISPETENELNGSEYYHKQSKEWQAAPYCPPFRGKRLMALKAQPPILREILDISIRRVTGDAMFVSAYILIDQLPGYLIGIMLEIAPKVEGGEVYAARLNQDVLLKVDVVRLLNNRLSIYRSTTKKFSRTVVEHKYNLDSGKPDRRSQITDLVQNSRFIFARKENSLEVDNTRPFQHPAVLSVLQNVYFSGRRGQSLANKHASRFTSSIKEGTGARELELPPAMVAMAATAVHASLDDFVTKQDFSADLYEDIYGKHITFLDQIRNASVRQYHRLMSDLYKLVSDHATSGTDVAENDAMQILDLNGLPE